MLWRDRFPQILQNFNKPKKDGQWRLESENLLIYPPENPGICFDVGKNRNQIADRRQFFLESAKMIV